MTKDKNGKGLSLDSDFKNIVSCCRFVDKSLLIKDIVDNRRDAPVLLITRPRRFGKSLNLDMIRTFFEKTEEDTSVYFKDLDIWKCGERYTSEQGKYPVIYLDLKDVRGNIWKDTYDHLKDKILGEYSRHKDAFSGLSGSDLLKYERIVSWKGTRADYESSLGFLAKCLYAHHGVKPVILIDEYDAPIQSGHDHKYYEKAVSFMRELFSEGLKGDVHMSFAVVTGVTRVSKEGIFSGLNNLKMRTVLNDELSSYFGFTEDEVGEVLEDFGCPEKRGEVCEWYDGYRFGTGETHVYNPWSVMNYITYDCRPAPYWANTSSNAVIGGLLENTSKDVEKNLRGLLEGGTVSAFVDENLTYGDLDDDPENIYGLLLMSGYLRCESCTDGLCELRIPNKEVRSIYRDEVIKKLWGVRGLNSAKKITEAIRRRDAEGFKEALKALVCMSSNHFNVKKESSYSDLMIGVLSSVDDVYDVRSEENLPDGMDDVTMTPKEGYRDRLPGVILEFERCTEGEDLEARAQEGRNQIDDKFYDERMTAQGIKDVYKIGVAFRGGNVAVRTEYGEKDQKKD